ncbi:hypothetical protein V8G54_015155 [Vigna mungo]|uniref:Uncharacterized protein n=1 Tax=Vigna mungo TaxID=3915 RepID=A0AAQ3NIY8_VIGMU
MWGKFSTHSIPLLWDKNVITAMSPLHQNDLSLLHAFSCAYQTSEQKNLSKSFWYQVLPQAFSNYLWQSHHHLSTLLPSSNSDPFHPQISQDKWTRESLTGVTYFHELYLHL